MIALLVLGLAALLFSIVAPPFLIVAIPALLIAYRIYTRRVADIRAAHAKQVAKAARKAARDRIAYFL